MFEFYGLNRTLCDVLEDMRKLLAVPTKPNKELLQSLVEEAQCMGNRMEAALSDKGDSEKLQAKIKKLKIQAKNLSKKVGDSND